MTDHIGVGAKHDAGKRRWDLLPWDAVAAAVDVLGFGAQKYGAHSWRAVPGARERYFAACIRHLHAWWKGEMLDPESGLPHLAHALCCVLFLLSKDTPNAER
jgi:hypothetical protein